MPLLKNIAAKPFLRFLSGKDGFTLIEMVITIIILGASSMILLPFFSSISNSPDPVLRGRAIALGQSMMDEILAKKWDENTIAGGGPILTAETVDSGDCLTNRIACYRAAYKDNLYAAPTATTVANLKTDNSDELDNGVSRVLYNDIDDFNNYTEEDSFRDQNYGRFDLDGYKRSVKVKYIPSTSNIINHDTESITLAGNPANTSDSKMIVVTVTTPKGEVFYFTSVKCNL